jgi:hypothetical protein
MGVMSIVGQSLALMIGSLLAACLVTVALWALAERIGRPWVALVLLPLLCAAMVLSPLAHSLFIRMLALFVLVGAGLLCCLGRPQAMPPAAIDRRRPPPTPDTQDDD